MLVKELMISSSSSGGSNCSGRTTVFHRGGRGLSSYSLVPFKFFDLCAIVLSVGFGGMSGSSLALLRYDNGCLGYFYSMVGVGSGSLICYSSGFYMPPVVGFGSSLFSFSPGSALVCLESFPGSGFRMASAPGVFGSLLKSFSGYSLISMPSGKLSIFSSFCSSFSGSMFDVKFKFRSFTKAGQRRSLGFSPSVRGVAMNPVDHPHGGGEGSTSGGSPSVTPWGRPTKGYRTASSKVLKSRFVLMLYSNSSFVKSSRGSKSA